ncbi:MAG TPA: autotransporter-associated beta strand repeat-containing protein [Gemmataceae bacterium]|jgi:autotransporter-associated beta strand protein
MRRLVLALAALSCAAPAAAQTWTGAAMDAGNWNNAANWNPATVPNSATADTVFTDAAAGSVVILSTVQDRSLTFNTTTGAYTLTSLAGQSVGGMQSITVGGGNTVNQAIDLANVAGGSLVFTGTGSAALSVTNNSDPSTNPTLTVGPNTVIGTAGGGGITVGGTGRTAITGSFSNGQPVTGGLTKAGAGALVLGGTGGNLGGPVALTGGTLRLDFNTNTAVKFAGTSPFSSAGGDVELVGNSATAITQNTGGTTLTAGHTQVNRSGGAAAVTFGAGGFTRSAGTTFDATNTGTLAVTTTTGMTNGLLGPGPAFATLNGSLWAGVSGGQLAGNPGMAGIFGSGVNSLISANTSIPTVTTNSLRFDVGSAITTLNGTVTLQSGGILVANTAGSPTITAGTVATNSELIVHQYSPGTLTINSNVNAPAGLTKTGPGLLSLGGDLTTSGPINVNRGGLQITSIFAVPSTVTSINLNDTRTGGNGLQQLVFDFGGSGFATVSRPIRLSAHSPAGSYANVFSTGTSANFLVTLSGVISSAPGATTPLRFDGAVGDSTSFRLTGVNTFTGTVQVQGGALGISTNASLGNLANGVVLSVGNTTAGGLEFVNSGTDLARPVSITVFSRVVCNVGQTNTISGPVTGQPLYKDGAGTLVLTNAGNAGEREVRAGTLAVTAAGLGTAGDYHLWDGAALSAVTTATLGAARTLTIGSGFGHPVGPVRGTVDVAAGQVFTLAGPVTEFAAVGPGTLVKTGTGTLTLTGVGNLYSGGTEVRAGELRVAANGGLGPAAAPVTVEPFGTLTFTGSTTTGRAFTLLSGTLSVAAGQTLTLSGATVGGGFLRGPGTYALTGGTALTGVTTFNTTVLTQTGAASYKNVTHGGSLTVSGGAANPAALDGFTNQGSGAMTIATAAGVGSQVTAADFQTYGTLTVQNAPGGFASANRLTNVGAGPLFFNGGSRTFLGTPATAGQLGAVLDLNGKSATVAGGLLVNNGLVFDSTNGGTATLIADFGALIKGGGTYGVPVVTVNGGRFQAGNSPGRAEFGRFAFGPGGVSDYVLAMNDAAGTAGPTPDADGRVSGWGLVRAVQQVGPATTQGDFAFTADPAHKLTVALQTLVNPTTAGTDVPGAMDHFDSTRAYAWPAVTWAGAYAGPADAAVLDAATAFDTTGLLNATNGGSFGWALDAAGHTLSLTFTPVPEPTTLALTAAAGLALGWRVRRRR